MARLAQTAWIGGDCVGLALGATTAQATCVEPQTWTRGVGGATYQAWDVFTDDAEPDFIVDNTPDVSGFVNLEWGAGRSAADGDGDRGLRRARGGVAAGGGSGHAALIEPERGLRFRLRAVTVTGATDV